jgi:hypothetical protein
MSKYMYVNLCDCTTTSLHIVGVVNSSKYM